MELSTSWPPHRRLVSTEVGNPFYSEKVQGEINLQVSRPRGLPELSPGDAEPIHDGGQGTGQCTGKGRGGLAPMKPGVFVTPPSRKSGRGSEGMVGHVAKQTEGQMPDESVATVKSMGKVAGNGEPTSVDELQRALEIEVVNKLREQNALLMSELEELRRHRNSPNSGFDSSSSWVEIPSDGMREGLGEKGLDAGGSKTPGSQVTFGKVHKYTPNGTRIPDGSPPEDPPVEIPKPPPVPPFPTEVHEDTTTMLDRYEVSHGGSKVRLVDQQWKPACEKQHEPTPGEARAFWLEREVMFLRQSLEKITNGNPFHASEYWSKGYHPPTGPPMLWILGDPIPMLLNASAEQIREMPIVTSWWKWKSFSSRSGSL